MRHELCPHPLLGNPDNLALLGEDWLHGRYCTEIASPDLMRALFGPSSASACTARSRVFYKSRQMQTRQKLPLGIHDRAEEYIFANGIIPEEDLPAIQRHLPFRVCVLRCKTLRVGVNEVFDLSAHAEWWPGLHFREELYVYVHINELIVEPGAELVVFGNVLVFCCDEVRLDKPEGYSARDTGTKDTGTKDIGTKDTGTKDTGTDVQLSIRGTRHYAFSNSRRVDAYDGLHGIDGRACLPPPQAEIVPSIFGPIIDNDGNRPSNSGRAEDGGDGGDGSIGTNGGMAMLADIRLGKLTHFQRKGFRIFGKAGDGNRGGHGGNGGNGGNGPIPGRGGHGGHGGAGGNGGLASNIFIQVPQTDQHLIDAETAPSAGGQGGTGGRKGQAGQALEQADNEDKDQNTDTLQADDGLRGQDGKTGKSRAGAEIYFIT